MPAVDPVILELRADVARYRNEIKSTTTIVDRSLAQQESSILRLETQFQRSSGSISRSAGFMRNSLVGLLAGVSVGALGKTFLSFADQFKQYEAQLRLATSQTGSFGQATEDVERIAAVTRSGLKETADLYGTFQRNARELGITQEQSARATETVTKAFQISGASAAEAAGGLRQFLQGIQSGTLRGEELNSVLENAPRLARLLADSLGVTIGQLRALGAEGQLSGDKLITALTDRRFTDGIDAEFKELPVTFDQAMTQVTNAAVLTFGAFDRGGEFSTMLANFITGGSEGFEDLAADAERLGSDIRASFAGLYDVFEPMFEGASSVFDRINLKAADTREYLGSLIDTYDRVNNFFIGIDRAARSADNALVRGGVQSPLYRRDLPAWSNAGDRFRSGFDRSTMATQARLQKRREEDRRPRPEQPPLPRVSAAVAKPKRSPRGPSAETLEKRAEAERLRELRDQQAFSDEQAAIQQDMLRARRASAVAADVIAEFDRQEKTAARDRQNAAYQASVQQKRLTETQAQELIAANNAVADEQLRAIDVRERQRIFADQVSIETAALRNQQDLLSSQLGLATNRRDRLRIELELLDLARREEEARLRAVLAAESTATAAEKRVAQDRLDALPAIYGADEQNIRRANASPLSRFREEIADTDTALENLQVDALRRLNDELTEGVKNALGLKGALGDVVGELIRIGIQRQVIGPLADALFGAEGGGGGQVGSFISSLFNRPGRASGGYVGPGQMVRVNEGASGGRVEGFMPNGGGKVIPLGRMNAMPSGGTTVVQQTFVLDARGGVTTTDLINQMNSLAQQAAVQGAQGGRALAARDMGSMNRPRI